MGEVINNDHVKLDPRRVGGILHLGGTILRTIRCEEFKTEKGLRKAVEALSRTEPTRGLSLIHI